MSKLLEIIHKKVAIIFNADDFGYGRPRNQGIIQLIENNQVSSVSLLVNGADAEFAIDYLLKRSQQKNSQSQFGYYWKNLSIGLHFNLTEGKPVSDKLRNHASPLIDQGNFLGKPKFYQAIIQSKSTKQRFPFSQQDIFQELHAQIKLFIELLGRRPTHIDGHNHVHVIPQIADIVGPVLQHYGIYRIRMPTQQISQPYKIKFNEIFIQNAHKSKLIFRKYKQIWPQHFLGLDMVDNFKQQIIINKIQSIKQSKKDTNSSLQIMCHPGYKDPNAECSFSQSQNRQNQKKVLESLKMSTMIEGSLSTFYQIIPPQFSQKNRILIYSKMDIGTGNYTTSLRLKQLLQKLKYQVYLRSIQENINFSIQVHNLANFLFSFKINLIIGVNMCRCAHIIHQATLSETKILYRVPYFIILAGTDVNSGILKENADKKYKEPIKQAQVLISLNCEMAQKMNFFLEKLNLKTNIEIIQQSTPLYQNSNHFEENLKINICRKYGQHILKSKYILFPSSFRKVKAIHHALKELNKIYEQFGVCTYIVGPILDKNYYNIVKQQLKQVKYLGVVPKQQYMILLNNCQVLINTSENQGMSCSILEAFAAKIPVIARNNKGNSNLIKHKHNGFLYQQPQQLYKIYKQLFLQNNELVKKVVQEGYSKFQMRYSYQKQEQNYRKVLEKYFLSRFCRINKNIIIFQHQEIHPASKVNCQLFNRIQPLAINLQTQQILDMGCGNGIFGLIYIEKLNKANKQIKRINLSEIKNNILGSALYNYWNNSHLWQRTPLILIQSDMFSSLPKSLKVTTILANLPQTPFRKNLRIDRSGGEDSFKYNRQLIMNWQKFSSQRLIMLYSYMSWPKQFRRVLEEQTNSEIIWESGKINHIIVAQDYEKLQQNLSSFIRQHFTLGRAEIEIKDDVFYVPAEILVITRKSNKV